MKCITLWQPFASLWVAGIKLHETRHWPTSHRGWLGVHAGKTMDACGLEAYDLLCQRFGHGWKATLPRGAIVGAVRIDGCYGTLEVRRQYLAGTDQGLWGHKPTPVRAADLACGNFTNGRFAWRAAEARMLTEPVPWRGAQGFFEVPDEVLAPILASGESGEGKAA